MKIYFIRHGHTVLTGPPDRFCGSSDPVLTKEGRQEIQDLANSLARQISPVTIYSSNLLRARESAKILADVLAIPVISTHNLREIDFGKWERLTKEEVEARNPKLYAQWVVNPVTTVPPGGNHPKEIVRHAKQFLQMVRTQTGPILVVAHKTFLRIALCAWLGIDLAQYRSSFDIHPATLGCVVFSDVCCQLTLLNWSPAVCLQEAEDQWE